MKNANISGEIIIDDFIINNHIKVIIKPNSKRAGFIDCDKEKKAINLAVSAPAEKNKANIEVIKFFSRLLKKKVVIVSGLTNREKVIKIIDK